VQVLHDHQQGSARGQPFDHAQHQREQPPLAGAVAGDGGRLAVQGQVGDQAAQLAAGWAGDRLQLGRFQVAGQAAQRLDQGREGQALLAQRHAAAAQHPHAPLGGGGGQPPGQPGLADPSLPTDQRHQRLTVIGAHQELPQQRQLLGTADEAPGHDLVGHAAEDPQPVLRKVRRGGLGGHLESS
jgi:hypothetical protein